MEQQTERRFYLREFKAITHAISTYSDLNLLNNHLVEGLCKAFKVKACSLLLFDEREQQLFHVSSHGLSKEYLSKGPIHVEGKSEEFLNPKPTFYKDFQNDPRVQYKEEAVKEGIVSMLSVPVKYYDAVIGLLRIYHTNEWTLNEEDIDSLTILAEQLGLVIEINGLKNFFEMVKGALGNLPLRMLDG